MSPHVRAMAVAVAALFAVPLASAQSRIMKCVDDHGRVTYTELGCDATSATRQAVRMTNNSFDGSRYASEARRRADVAPTPPRTQARAEGSTSSEDIARRRRELTMTAESVTASEEEKQAAQDELGRLNRGVSQRLTDGERRLRDDLMRDTASIDQQRRAKAQKELEHLQDRHESREYVAAREAEREHKRRLREIQASQQAAQNAEAAHQARASAQLSMAASDGDDTAIVDGRFYTRFGGGFTNSSGKFIPVP